MTDDSFTELELAQLRRDVGKAATFDPGAVAALLNQVEALEAERDRLKWCLIRYAAHQFPACVDAPEGCVCGLAEAFKKAGVE